jgi:hypothetical protein
MFRSSCARTRSATPLTISAPSWGGVDMYSERACTEGHINDLHDSLRNVQPSAAGAAVNSNPFMISFARLAVGPDSYCFNRALSSGDPAWAK